MDRRIALITSMLLFLPTAVLGEERLIAIQGSASIEVEPDRIAMEVIVESTHKTDVAKAKAVVDQVSSRVAESLIAAGVDKDDITSATMIIDTEERYDRNDNPVEIGHRASREIDVTLRDVASYTSTIQALVDVGVTRIVGVRAEVSNYDELRLEVLGAAAKDARMKAEYLASQLDSKVTQVHRIGDHRVDSRFGHLEEVVVSAQRSNAPTPFEFRPGKIAINASIYVEFELE